MRRHFGAGQVRLVGNLRASAASTRCRRTIDFWSLQFLRGLMIALAGLAILGLASLVTR